tara:strand:- start:410 stop:1039 length:630 start_codon:yes stop_codon:yes gene_type:complete
MLKDNENKDIETKESYDPYDGLFTKLKQLTPEERVLRATILKDKMSCFQVQNNRTHAKFLNYSNSSTLRYQFWNWIIHAYYTDRNITASIITIEMGCSRKAVDEMVNDCVAEEWLRKTKGKNAEKTKIFLSPTAEPLGYQAEWFEWYIDEMCELRGQAYRDYIGSLAKEKTKNNAQFNTLNGANLGGIEENVTSFIVNSSKKRVNREKI